jgi:hypothetical protein
MRNPGRLGLYMVLPRFTSPFRCMRSRFAKHLSYPFGTQLSFHSMIKFFTLDVLSS